MDTARYVVAVLIVTFMPPGLLWWFIVHPFITLWRRIGTGMTLTGLSVGALLGVVALFEVRDRLVGPDLGTYVPLVVASVMLLAAAVWIAILRKKHLTTRIMVGLPQLNEEADNLLTEGIYGVIRHPRYVEIGLGALAYGVFANHLGAYLVTLATFPALHLIVLFEEYELRERFGDAYRDYAERVPRYVPWGKP